MALITPIQSAGAHSTGSVASLAKAFDSNVTAGNVLVVFGGVWFTGDVSTTVTDSQGNTYTQHGGNVKMRKWTAVAESTGPCTVTVSVVSSTNFLSIGLAELPAGTYNYTPVTLRSESGTVPTSNDFVVTEDGAALFAMMTCQGNPSGTITEDAAWALITENTNFSFLPYSWIWRNADIGTYQAEWTVGASITCYMAGLVIEGVPDTVTIGTFVCGAHGTPTSTLTFLANMDGVTRTAHEPKSFVVAGKFKVFGTGAATNVPSVELGFAEVAISSAELLALRATPKTLVAAPGAGKVLEFIGAVLLLDATATAYVESSANLGVKYTNGSGVQVSETIEATGFIDQTTDTLTIARPKLDAIAAKAGCENQALVLHNLGVGEYTTGTGTMRVKVATRTWTTGW